MPRGAAARLRAGTLRHAVRPQRGRHHIPAALRRAFDEFRRAAGAAFLLCGRPHGARHGACPVPAQRPRPHPVLRGVDGARSDSRCLGPGPWRDRAGNGDRPGLDPAGPRNAFRHGRRGAHLLLEHQRLHQHRRRARHGGAGGRAPGRHGVLPVPSHGRRRRGRAHHRRRARRRRVSPEQERRALHGALCAEPEGPGEPGRRLARHGDRDQGRPRRRQGRRLPAAETRSPRAGSDRQAPAGHTGNLHQVRRRGPGEGTHPGGPHGPLHDGRHPDQLSRRSGGPQGRRPQQPGARFLCGRGMRVRVGPRCQPAGDQLAHRPAGVRQVGRRLAHRLPRRESWL